MEGYEHVTLEAVLTEEEFWACMDEIASGILAAIGYNAESPGDGTHETEPEPETEDIFNKLNIQDVAIEPSQEDQHDGTRIKINIRPRSFGQYVHIRDTCTSGALEGTLRKLTLALVNYYRLRDLSVEAKLAEPTTNESGGDSHTAGENLGVEEVIEPLEEAADALEVFKNEPGNGNQADSLFKILVVGDPTVGKTAMLGRYVRGEYRHDYKQTIGVDFQLKVLPRDQGDGSIKLQLWDISGQERYTSMTRVYYHYAVGALVMFDQSQPLTLFKGASKWKQDIDKKVHLANGSPVPCFLMANKCDLAMDPDIDRDQISDLCKEMGFKAWFSTSAKDNININEAVQCLVDQILIDSKAGLHIQPNKEDIVVLSPEDKPGPGGASQQ